MADHAEDDDFDGDIFIYWGGRAPQHVTHVLIDKSVDDIELEAFYECYNLLTVDTHDGIRKIGAYAFYYCTSLKQINLKSAVEIDERAFCKCNNLESVEFGDRLETIGVEAFCRCSLTHHLKLRSIITIERRAFEFCRRLIDIELSERLQTIEPDAFQFCEFLQRIAVPLKRDLFELTHFLQRYTQFDYCEQLTTVDLIGQDHTKAIASLHMENWRTEISAEINRINQVLPNTHADDKTGEIKLWIDSVMDKMDHYKAEHGRYVSEGITLLELALWKATLDEKEDNSVEGRTKKAKVDAESVRKERRVTCGADIVIKNVLPFLKLEE